MYWQISFSNYFWQFLLQHKHLYSIKSPLAYVFSRQHVLQFVHLILWILSARLLTRFDDELAINLAFSKLYSRRYSFCNYLSIFINSCNFIFCCNWTGYVYFSILSQIIVLCSLIYYWFNATVTGYWKDILSLLIMVFFNKYRKNKT